MQAGTAGSDSDRSGRPGGAYRNAVDAQFSIEIEIIGRINLAAVVAAAPDACSGSGELNLSVVGRTSLPLAIDHFDIDKRDILAVGL